MPCSRSARPAVPAAPAAFHREDTLHGAFGVLLPHPQHLHQHVIRKAILGAAISLSSMSFHVTKSCVPLTRGCGEGLLYTLTPSPAARVQRGAFSQSVHGPASVRPGAKVEPRRRRRGCRPLGLLWTYVRHWDTDEQSSQLMLNQGQGFGLSLSGAACREGGMDGGGPGLRELVLRTPPSHRAASP